VYCLHSFVPAKGAVADKDGIFGMIKCRGTFNTVEEADQQATSLIKKVDSIHKIHVCKVGHPFPMTHNSKFASEQKEVDLKEQLENTIMTHDIKEQRSDQKREINEIQEREKMLFDDVTAENELDKYIMTRVRRAQLIWTFVENCKKLDGMRKSIDKSNIEINEADEIHPDFKKFYFERYLEARKAAGVPDTDDSFVKFMDLKDIKIPTLIMPD